MSPSSIKSGGGKRKAKTLCQARRETHALFPTVNYSAAGSITLQSSAEPAATQDAYYEEHLPAKKTSTGSAKPKTTKASAKVQVNHEASHPNNSPAVKAAAVPAPIPDTGIDSTPQKPETRTAISFPAAQTTPTALVDILAPTTSLTPASLSTVSPPYLGPSITDGADLAAPTGPYMGAPSNALSQPSPSPRSSPAHLSTAIISLIAVGGFFILFAACIVLRTFTRPRRRQHPTPSLPILQEDSPPEKGGDESPLFGGQERLSRASAGARWTWTQYQVGATPKANASKTSGAGLAAPRPGVPRFAAVAPQAPAAIPFEPATYPDKDVTIQVAKTAIYAQPVAQSVGHEDGVGRDRYKSRLSTMTVSQQQAAEAYYAQDPDEIGLAVSSEELARIAYDPSSATLARSASDKARRTSVRKSMRPYDPRRSTFHSTGSPRDGLAYVMSPPLAMAEGDVTADATAAGGGYIPGRARVRAPYGAGSFLRTSVSTSAASARGYSINPFDDANFVAPPLPPMPQGGRTDALAAALGLGASAPSLVSPSMRTTLYPDDSLSVAGDRKRASKILKASAGGGGGLVGSPREAASTALGQLMMSSMSPVVPVPSNDSGLHGTAGTRKRAEDRPPRVPSPPPMPSLAQMAMANEEGFADYRSPTYSIYGMYDTDRKSRVEG